MKDSINMTRKESLEKSIADLSEALDLDYIGDAGWCLGDPYEVLQYMERELADLITDNDLASERGYDGDL